MVEAPELQALGHDLWLWQAYDPAVKSDLFSGAAKTEAGLFLVDAIALSDTALKELASHGAVSGVVVTNANHVRAAKTFAKAFGVPIFASASVLDQLFGTETHALADREKISAGLTTIAIEGA